MVPSLVLSRSNQVAPDPGYDLILRASQQEISPSVTILGE